MTQEMTKPRLRILHREGVQVVQKQASAGLARDLVENERRALELLSGKDAPSLVATNTDGPLLTLYRAFIPGTPLGDTPLALWPGLLAQLEQSMQRVHALGLVHGDLKPSNLIVTGPDILAIDWEHALPIGADIAALPYRAVSLGTSDPSLIWGRGTVTEAIDRYSIARMYDMVDPKG